MEDIFNHHLHHANLIISSSDQAVLMLEEAIKKHTKIDNLSSNPDYFCGHFPVFTIKDSLSIRQQQSRKAFKDSERFFVLVIETITTEAENALLKTFEEPSPNTYFFIIARSAEIFLPTLRSRFQIIKFHIPVLADKQIENFVKMSLVERLDFIGKEFVKNKNISKHEVFNFLQGLEIFLFNLTKTEKNNKDIYFVLQEIEKGRSYLTGPRSSIRLILEHLALVVPLR